MGPVTEDTTEQTGDAGQPAGGSETDSSAALEAAYPDLDVTLYVRPGASTVTKERQSQIRDRFESLTDIAVLEDITVENWSKEVNVPKEGRPTDEDAVELFDELRSTVDNLETTGRLEPFFEERPQVSSFFSESTTERILVFPVLGVTVRRGDELVGLYPCWLDGSHYSVGDCLDTLEAGEPPTNLE